MLQCINIEKYIRETLSKFRISTPLSLNVLRILSLLFIQVVATGMAIDPTSTSPLNTALKGLNRSFESISRNASKVANFATSDNAEGSLAEPLIEINRDLQEIQAITKVIKVTQEMDDAVLDIIA